MLAANGKTMAINLSGLRLLTVLWCGWGIHGKRVEKVRKTM